MQFLHNDTAFLRALGGVLMGLGGAGLLLGLNCLGDFLPLCGQEWVPILTGLEGITLSFTQFTLPLCLLLCGFGVRNFGPTSWLMVVMLLSMTGGVFGLLLYFDASAYGVMMYENRAGLRPYLVFNSASLLLCLLGVAYLTTRPVRVLFGMMPGQPPRP